MSVYPSPFRYAVVEFKQAGEWGMRIGCTTLSRHRTLAVAVAKLGRRDPEKFGIIELAADGCSLRSMNYLPLRVAKLRLERGVP